MLSVQDDSLLLIKGCLVVPGDVLGPVVSLMPVEVSLFMDSSFVGEAIELVTPSVLGSASVLILAVVSVSVVASCGTEAVNIPKKATLTL